MDKRTITCEVESKATLANSGPEHSYTNALQYVALVCRDNNTWLVERNTQINTYRLVVFSQYQVNTVYSYREKFITL